MFIIFPPLHPSLIDLLGRLRNDLLVIGSVARGNKPPADIDIWLNCDGFVGGEPKYHRHCRIISESKLPFVSVFPMSWTFPADRFPPIQVELIGAPNIEVSFRQARRRANRFDIGGIELHVAAPEHAGTKMNVTLV